ncbi:MAG: rRNA maturation RNase YbeY [Parachlamydiales bacterium]
MVFNRQKDLKVSLPLTKRAVSFFLAKMKAKSRSVALYLVSQAEIKKIHKQFFHDGTATDTISFPFDPPSKAGFLGEVFVCPKTALEYAEKNRLNPLDETLLYILHGLLHLLGENDQTIQEKRTMQKKEKTSMKLLKDNLRGLSKRQLKAWL